MTKQVHIIVNGVVQGVSFRAYAREAARALGVRGYVRNLPTGAVEIVAEGDEEALRRLVVHALWGSGRGLRRRLTAAAGVYSPGFNTSPLPA